jgi:hypothetical protein
MLESPGLALHESDLPLTLDGPRCHGCIRIGWAVSGSDNRELAYDEDVPE